MADPLGTSVSLLLVVAGAALCIAEAFAPGAHFVVIGVALLVAGIVGVLFPGFASPLVLAVLVFVVGVAALWAYRNLRIYQGTGRGKTEGSRTLRGARGVVTERVTHSEGEVRLRDGGFNPYYAARVIAEGDDIPEGASVVVVDPGGGNVLTVAEVDGADEIDRELARGRAAVREPEPGEAESEER